MRPIPGHPSYYASRCGKVYSRHTNRVLKDCNCAGYRQVALSTNGRAKTFKVHRLIAKTFIPNLNSKPDVNHKDGNKANNYVGNLEWCTELENVQHAVRTGLFRRSKSTGRKADRIARTQP